MYGVNVFSHGMNYLFDHKESGKRCGRDVCHARCTYMSAAAVTPTRISSPPPPNPVFS